MARGGGSHSSRGAGTDLWLAAMHDLRQPLQSALLLLSSAGREEVGERRRHALQLAELALLDLQSMLDDLALASRLDVGERPGVGRKCRLADAVTAAVEELRGAAGAQELSLRIDPGAATRLVDQSVCRSLALALLGASLKYPADGRIGLAVWQRRGRVTLAAELETQALPVALRKAYFIELPLAPSTPPLRLFVPGLGLAAHVARGLGGCLALRRISRLRWSVSLAVTTL